MKKNNKTIKSALALAFMLSSVSVYAQDTHTGGGDTDMQKQYLEMLADVRLMIETGKSAQLKFPDEMSKENYPSTLDRYNSEMLKYLPSLDLHTYMPVVVNFTDRVLMVNGTEAICESYIPASFQKDGKQIACNTLSKVDFLKTTECLAHTTCNIERFKMKQVSFRTKLKMEKQYQQAHHETAVLAGIEDKNGGALFTYPITRQITATPHREIVWRLAIKQNKSNLDHSSSSDELCPTGVPESIELKYVVKDGTYITDEGYKIRRQYGFYRWDASYVKVNGKRYNLNGAQDADGCSPGSDKEKKKFSFTAENWPEKCSIGFYTARQFCACAKTDSGLQCTATENRK